MVITWIKPYFTISFVAYILYFICCLQGKTSLHNYWKNNDNKKVTKIWQMINFSLIENILYHERNLSNSSIGQEKMTVNKLDVIQNGIFWTELAESFVPKGSLDNDSMELVQKLRNQSVKTIRKARQNDCGDELNGIVELSDGTKMCARREKNPITVYAEALAFYLSRLLHMDNVPEVFLSTADKSLMRWKNVNLTELKWTENDTVAMLRWIPETGGENFLPQVIREAYRTGTPFRGFFMNSTDKLNSEKPATIADVIQWGSLIVFDYLIGHFDRLLHYQNKLKPCKHVRTLDDMLYNSLRASNGKMWLIDNESAFFYQYKKLGPLNNARALRPFHDRMLKTMCVFQTSIVKELHRLSKHTSPFEQLWHYATSFEPQFDNFPKDDRFKIFAEIFNTQLAEIMKWILYCEMTTDKH